MPFPLKGKVVPFLWFFFFWPVWREQVTDLTDMYGSKCQLMNSLYKNNDYLSSLFSRRESYIGFQEGE